MSARPALIAKRYVLKVHGLFLCAFINLCSFYQSVWTRKCEVADTRIGLAQVLQFAGVSYRELPSRNNGWYLTVSHFRILYRKVMLIIALVCELLVVRAITFKLPSLPQRRDKAAPLNRVECLGSYENWTHSSPPLNESTEVLNNLPLIFWCTEVASLSFKSFFIVALWVIRSPMIWVAIPPVKAPSARKFKWTNKSIRCKPKKAMDGRLQKCASREFYHVNYSYLFSSLTQTFSDW